MGVLSATVNSSTFEQAFHPSTIKQRVMMAIDDRYKGLTREFNHEARAWRRDVGASSFSDEVISHPAYQRIIGMGMIAVPHILRAFAKKHWEYWSHALHLITGHSVGPCDSYEEIQEKWIAWGKARGFLDDATFNRIQKIHQQRKQRQAG